MSSPAAISSGFESPNSTGPSVAEIDASFRLPTLALASKAICWLVVGSLLLLLASVKLHGPGMMAGKAWLTYGRILPAGWNALVYGFAGQACALAGLWILARAAGQRLQAPLLVIAGCAIWNIGVLAGLVGILSGASTGREWLEMPAGAMAALVIAAALFGVCGWMTHAARTRIAPYPSAWFVLLALLSFVWFGSTALAMLSGEGAHGVLQVLIQRWYAGGIVRLWLGGFVVAAAFHFLPTLVDRPLASRQLALIGFWCLTFFAPWAITRHGDPVPRWLVSAGVAGSFLAAIALLAFGLNWWKTVEGQVGRVFSTTTGRLVGGSVISYLVAGLLQLLLSFQGFSAVARLTWLEAGLDWLSVGSATLAALGVIPILIQRSTGKSMAPGLVSAHAGLSVAGVLITALPLVLGGWVFGSKLQGNTATFLEALRGSMHLVRLSTLGLTILFVGQVALAVAFLGVAKALVTEWITVASKWSAPVASGKTAGVRS